MKLANSLALAAALLSLSPAEANVQPTPTLMNVAVTTVVTTPTPLPTALEKRQGLGVILSTLLGVTVLGTDTIGLGACASVTLSILSASICYDIVAYNTLLSPTSSSCSCTASPAVSMRRREEQVLIDQYGDVRIGIKKRALLPKQICSSRLTGCKVDPKSKTPGLKVFDGDKYKCVDLENDVESCGGCVSEGRGRDCTAIDYVEDVLCERGSCKVLSCEGKFAPSGNGTSCQLDLSGKKRGLGRSVRNAQKFWH